MDATISFQLVDRSFTDYWSVKNHKSTLLNLLYDDFNVNASS